MELVPTKVKILTDIQAEWQLLKATLDLLSEEQLLVPGVIGEWSVKDIMSHIVAWEKVLIDRIEGVMSEQPLKYPPIMNDEDVNLFNSHIFIDNRLRPLSAVRLEFTMLYEGIVKVIETLDEDDLTRPVPWDWASDNLRLWHIIVANTTDHYQEHRLEIEKFFNL